MGAILTSREQSALGQGLSRGEAFIDGFRVALLVGAIIALAGAVTAGLLIRKAPHHHEPEPVAEVA
jgi:hypothetical protein